MSILISKPVSHASIMPIDDMGGAPCKKQAMPSVLSTCNYSDNFSKVFEKFSEKFGECESTPLSCRNTSSHGV